MHNARGPQVAQQLFDGHSGYASNPRCRAQAVAFHQHGNYPRPLGCAQPVHIRHYTCSTMYSQAKSIEHGPIRAARKRLGGWKLGDRVSGFSSSGLGQPFGRWLIAWQRTGTRRGLSRPWTPLACSARPRKGYVYHEALVAQAEPVRWLPERSDRQVGLYRAGVSYVLGQA